ncbi:MAG: hypothetical protein Q7T30_03065 [Planctomycetota bacterium]|nr:hypothetical protein [Planctomycetota bacterium]
MRFPSHLPALVLPLFAAFATAQVETQVAGLTRNNSALRLQGGNCTNINLGCLTGLPATLPLWAGGTAYDAQSGEFWVSEGNVVARVSARGCATTCGPWPAPGIAGVVTGLEVIETENRLLVLDSTGTLTTLSLSGSCNGPQLIGSCGTGLAPVGQRLTTGLGYDELRGLAFYTITDFANGTNQIAVAHLPTTCVPFNRRPLPVCGPQFQMARGAAVDAARRLLYVTDGRNLMAVPYAFDPSGPSIAYGLPVCCPSTVITADPLVGLALRPSPGEPVGQSCSNGSCAPCPTRHALLNGAVIGNPNLLFHLGEAQDNTLTWLALGFGACSNTGPLFPPLCGPVLVAGSAAMPPLVAGPYPVGGGSGPCQASATVVVAFPYDTALLGSDWSSQFLSLCVGISSTVPFGTAMSNCLNWTVGSP